MLSKEIIEKIINLCQEYPQVKLLYIFGSQARGDAGPLSDYDFAVYLDENDAQKRFDIKLYLIGKLTSILQTNAVDVAVINDTESPFLKYAAIKDGILLFQKEFFKVAVETAIMSEYFDLRESFLRFNFAK
ncbi:MAG: nucleotidyltransferase domain-containing protein [Candidatus Nealsonbacteria bacterium DGGOD1a]|jgi:Predicted nucleotidyltransferases|nr:MAG: nucleotidyltransferase domain-containing protein [Candidatus Nealsonbacteria bacterium DGGOD1a]